MDGMEGAVIDAPVVETDASQPEPAQSTHGTGASEQENPYAPKTSREYSQWLKSLKESGADEKLIRMSKDNHARMFALSQLEPKGIDGVREKYALIDGLQYGELKGPDALNALQDAVQSVNEVDERIAQGDVSVLESFDDEMKAGVMRMVPNLLEMQREMDPEGYAKAVLPHFVEALRGSELVQGYNALVDVLSEKMPAWLPEDKKQAWTDDRLSRVYRLVGGMGAWLNAQEEKAKGAMPGGAQPREKGQPPQDKTAQELDRLQKKERDEFWNRNVGTQLDAHAEKRFDDLFRPYGKRLKLGKEQIDELKYDFSKTVSSQAKQNKQYMMQINRYHAMKNPDASTVLNLAKIEFDKHASEVMKKIIGRRYGPFLAGKPRPAAPAQAARPATAAAGAQVQIVAVKPQMKDIDYKNTPREWIHEKKFRLYSGKVVQVRQ